jgi:DnaJ-class molecular chaperone
MTIKEEGMPIFEGHGHGDLYVEFNVVLPATLSTDTRSSTFRDSQLRRFLLTLLNRTKRGIQS